MKKLVARKEYLEKDFMKQYEIYRDVFLTKKFIKGTDQQSIAFAYVIFKSMDNIEDVEEAYDAGKCEVCLVQMCGSCCCKEYKNELQSKYIFNKWPNIKLTESPDNIKWENLGIGLREKLYRRCIVWMITLAILAFSLFFILWIRVRYDNVEKSEIY